MPKGGLTMAVIENLCPVKLQLSETLVEHCFQLAYPSLHWLLLSCSNNYGNCIGIVLDHLARSWTSNTQFIHPIDLLQHKHFLLKC